jgi:hypothetical protein
MTTEADTLRALADRCEREEPSVVSDLDWCIHRAVGRSGWSFYAGKSEYTTSIDAAVTLAPEWWRVAHLEQYLARTGDWGVTLKAYNPSSGDNAYATAIAKTEAMARCAAALRARAAVLEQEGSPISSPSSEAASTQNTSMSRGAHE